MDTAALAASWASTELFLTRGSSIAERVFWTIALVLIGLFVSNTMGLYRARVCTLRTVEYGHIVRSCIVVALVALAGSAVFHDLSPKEILFGTSFAFLFTIVLRGGYRAWLANQRRLGRFLRPVLLFGTGNESGTIVALLREHPELGYRTVGLVGDESEVLRLGLEDSWCGDLDEGVRILSEEGAGTGAIVCAGDLRSSQLNQIVQELLKARIHVHLSTGLQGVDVGRLRPSPLAHEPFFYVEPVTLATWQLVTKRGIEVLLSSMMLILTLPLLLLAALGIKLQDFGPVIFKQWRVGREGVPFVVYKLRTMREGAEEAKTGLLELNLRDGPLTKFRRDPRVTRLGRFLRATSIDELPQLWNVLNGTMSLVGPRPALPAEVTHFDAELRARESVRPGITGLWQVEGRDNPFFAAYRRFDLFYLENWSVALDLMILFSTVESTIARALRSLVHPHEEIALTPPLLLRDPEIEPARVLRVDTQDIGPHLLGVTGTES